MYICKFQNIFVCLLNKTSTEPSDSNGIQVLYADRRIDKNISSFEA